MIGGKFQNAVMLTPKVGYGQPAITRLGVNTEAISSRFHSGEHLADLAVDYGATPEELEEALRCTRELVCA